MERPPSVITLFALLSPLTITFFSRIMVSMNLLDKTRRVQVIRCLVEGNSIRSTVRITGVAKNTVVKLLLEMGRACEEYQDKTMARIEVEV